MRRGVVAGVLVGALGVLAARPASAMCNVIPAATRDFRAATGSTNRPFASPGDYVEVRVRPQICDAESTGFADLDSDTQRADDQVVSVLFLPPQGAPHAVVLAPSCAGVDVAGCAAALGAGGTAECRTAGVGDVLAPNPNELQFRFPDTDTLVGTPGDDQTRSGPAKIVVSRRGAALRCDLAQSRCAALGGTTATTGVVACIDELYRTDGTCRARVQDVDKRFGSFTALPPPNDVQALIQQPANTPLHLTTDAAGNVLIPMDYAGVLLRPAGVPVPILARGATSIEAFAGSGQAAVIPGDGFINSFSPEGIVLPPVFTPIVDPTDPNQATLFGSVDAPRGVHRIARRGCVGGPDEGRGCSANGECSSGECSATLFDFADRYVAGIGPVNVLGGPGGEYEAELDVPVPLEGLTTSSETFAFVLSEGVDGVDRNGDGDTTDFVATLRDRDTGAVQPIGTGGTQGRAAVRVRQEPFAYPALDAEGGVVGFLESEAGQNNVDVNANGAVFEAVLRSFELGDTNAIELTQPAAPPTASTSPAFEGQSLSLSDGLLFFRTEESREASQTTARVSQSSTGAGGNNIGLYSSLSRDGRFVAFGSLASNLVVDDTNGQADYFRHDRATGQTIRVSVNGSSVQVAGGVDINDSPAISGNGQFVAFLSSSPDLVSGDSNAASDVFVRDVVAGTTTRVSVSSSGSQAALGVSHAPPAISFDGRLVAFASTDAGLVAGDTNGQEDVFIRDRLTGQTSLVSVNATGGGANGASSNPAMSSDGRFVALLSQATNLVAADATGLRDVFVRDRVGGTTALVSVSSAGQQANALQEYQPGISDDGRFVSFTSSATNLVPGDTNGIPDVFLHDRDADEDGRLDEPGFISTIRVSVSSAGVQAPGGSFYSDRPCLAADGSRVAFTSFANNLVQGDTNGSADVFLYDRESGQTTRVSVASNGAQVTGINVLCSMSADGSVVGFRSSGVVGSAPSGQVHVRIANPAATLADRTGDGVLDDTVLRVLDTGTGPPSGVADLCPAELVTTAAGRAAFLRPESAGPTTKPGCSGPALTGPDLNGDAPDVADLVAHLYDGAGVQNLRCAASDLDLSPTRLAALVTETGIPQLSLRSATASEPQTCADASWIHTGLAADAVGVAGDRVAILTRESAQGAGSLNADSDTTDRVIRLVEGTTGALVPLVDGEGAPVLPQAAEEMVVGESLVAFRTLESAEGGAPLNDGDTLDGVLQVYDLVTGELYNSRNAVTPCRLVACDPRRPYRVSRDTVRFLTLEVEQGTLGGDPDCDLNDDGDCADLLVQLFNVVTGEVEVVGEVTSGGLTSASVTPGTDPLETPAEQDPTVPSTQVLLSKGRCAEPTTTSCQVASPTACGIAELCFAAPGVATGTCIRDVGQTCSVSAPPATNGCDPGATCFADFTVIGVADADADEIPDPIDVCPEVVNPDQADADQDGAGDACDLATCGNGLVEFDPVSGDPFETCDDGNLQDDDGCSSLCHVEPAAPVCDADGDFDVDQLDVTIIVAARGQLVAPGDLRDADGDGRITVLDARRCAVQCEATCTTSVGCGLLGIEPLLLLAALRAGRRRLAAAAR